MDLKGLSLCSRFAYPPNSFSLCGPDRQNDLKWYSNQGKTDKGTKEILSQFSTLFPYLSLIARENNLKNPFDRRVVEAYWLGNNLLKNIPISRFIRLLNDEINLWKKIKKIYLEKIFKKVINGGLIHHSFHVINVYKRTGNIDHVQTIETMDACIINWGRINKIMSNKLIVETKPLRISNNKLIFGKPMFRNIFSQGEKDLVFQKLKEGDFVSYHWGYFCHKLNQLQLHNLIHFTSLSLKLANLSS